MITRRVDQPLSRHLCSSVSFNVSLSTEPATPLCLSYYARAISLFLSCTHSISLFVSLSISIFFFFFVLSLFLRHLLSSELFRPFHSYQRLANPSLLLIHLLSLSLVFSSSTPTMSVPTYFSRKFCFPSFFCVFSPLVNLFLSLTVFS